MAPISSLPSSESCETRRLWGPAKAKSTFFAILNSNSARAQRPAVAEDDGLSCSPVIEIDLRSILSSKRAHGASLLVGFVKSDGPLFRKNRADVRTGCRIYGFPLPPLRASDFAFHLLNLIAGTF